MYLKRDTIKSLKTGARLGRVSIRQRIRRGRLGTRVAQHVRLPPYFLEIAHHIHPDLNQKSIFGFCLRTYVLGSIDARFGTKQVGRAPYDPPGGEELKLQTAAVAAVEAGVNASMA